jgi:hypothetical protein
MTQEVIIFIWKYFLDFILYNFKVLDIILEEIIHVLIINGNNPDILETVPYI